MDEYEPRVKLGAGTTDVFTESRGEHLISKPVEQTIETEITSSASTESESPRTDRDIQRGALEDLINLAATSAATESDIQRQHKSSLEKLKQDTSDREFQIENRFKAQTDEVAQKHKERFDELARQYQNERARITAVDKETRKKLEAEKQSVDEELKEKYNQAAWLADSVHEVSSNQVAAAYKASIEQAKKTHREAAALNYRSAVWRAKRDVQPSSRAARYHRAAHPPPGRTRVRLRCRRLRVAPRSSIQPAIEPGSLPCGLAKRGMTILPGPLDARPHRQSRDSSLPPRPNAWRSGRRSTRKRERCRP